jgi:hypothetical protein
LARANYLLVVLMALGQGCHFLGAAHHGRHWHSAGLSETVHEWPWPSARRRQLVDRSPVDEEIRWSEQLESRLDELQVATIRECLNRQRPFGQSEWQTERR